MPSRRKRPRLSRLKAGGHVWKVKYHRAWPEAHSDVLGSVDTTTNTMLLNDEDHLSQDRKDETFIHEVVEILNQQFELELPHWKITALGEGLFQILRDNDGWWRG